MYKRQHDVYIYIYICNYTFIMDLNNIHIYIYIYVYMIDHVWYISYIPHKQDPDGPVVVDLGASTFCPRSARASPGRVMDGSTGVMDPWENYRNLMTLYRFLLVLNGFYRVLYGRGIYQILLDVIGSSWIWEFVAF